MQRLRTIRDYVLLCYRAGDNMTTNLGIEMAGYLTFLLILSLFPYLILIISAAGLIGQGEAGRQFIELVLQHLPAEAVATIRPRIVEIITGPPQELLTFAVLGTIWTSSSAIEGIRSMLNRAYRVGAPPAYLKRRLTSIAQIIILTVLIVCVMAVLVFTPIAMNHFTYFTGIDIPIQIQNFLTHYFVYLSGIAMFVVVASLYYVLPNLKQTLASVIPGALLVMALWLVGASLVSFYLTQISELTPVYGSLSGFIGTFIFFYVMIIIFIYGAEFNHELVLARGQKIEEREDSHPPTHPE